MRPWKTHAPPREQPIRLSSDRRMSTWPSGHCEPRAHTPRANSQHTPRRAFADDAPSASPLRAPRMSSQRAGERGCDSVPRVHVGAGSACSEAHAATDSPSIDGTGPAQLWEVPAQLWAARLAAASAASLRMVTSTEFCGGSGGRSWPRRCKGVLTWEAMRGVVRPGRGALACAQARLSLHVHVRA